MNGIALDNRPAWRVRWDNWRTPDDGGAVPIVVIAHNSYTAPAAAPAPVESSALFDAWEADRRAREYAARVQAMVSYYRDTLGNNGGLYG